MSSKPLFNEKFISREDQILSLIKGLHVIHKGAMKSSYYIRLSEHLPYPSIIEIIELFGSWDNLLLKAEIISSDEFYAASKRVSKNMKRHKLNTADSLKLCSSYLGNRFTVKDYCEIRKKHPKMISVNTILYHFDSWKNALLLHGYKPTNFYTEDDCIQSVKRAILEINPSSVFINSKQYSHWVKQNKGNPSLSTVITRFKTWNNVMKNIIVLN